MAPPTISFRAPEGKSRSGAPGFAAETVTPITGRFDEVVQLAFRKDGVAVSKQQARTAIDAAFAEVPRLLGAGTNVNVRGLGTFRLVVRTRRVKGQLVKKVAVAFRPAQELRVKVGDTLKP